MKNINDEKFDIIINISPAKLQDAVNISRSMAQKYKSSSFMPPLEKAYVLERKLNIPMQMWVELKNYRNRKSIEDE